MKNIYRNLNATGALRWSTRTQGRAGVLKCVSAIAENVVIKQPSGKVFETCLNGGHRAIFAWFKVQETDLEIDVEFEIPTNAQRVRFNPKNGDRFFHIDGERVDSLSVAFFTGNGECWGIR